MLGILICYATFHSFYEYQKKNIEKFVKCPAKIYINYTKPSPDASCGHMMNLNYLLDLAWEECDSFLFLDNDMIFLDDFTEPEEDCWYYSTERINIEYAWPNLMYFKKHPLMRKLDYANESDSGGSSWEYLKENITKKKISIDNLGFDSYRKEIEVLQKEYNIPSEHERFFLNNIPVFHFRAMSNYQNRPKEFMEKKEQLILSQVKDSPYI